MTLFSEQQNMQAYLKAGALGFAGAGKTYTSAMIAIGLVKLLKERNLPEGGKPIFFLDTETGSDYVAKRIKDSGIRLHVARTRAFADLVPAVREAEKNGSVMIIDSVTHFWREFTEAFARRKNRTRLQFEDWAFLKAEWGKFTDVYINSSAHIILCGRAGYEYDYFEDDAGKKQLEKTGIKMKAETEMGYEPSLLILMERELNMDTKQVERHATILKDRFGLIDGKIFKNPVFDDFLPHIQELNLGGVQMGVDTTRNSDGMIEPGEESWPQEKRRREIELEELRSLLTKHDLDGTAAATKKARVMMLEKHYGTSSATKLESYGSDTLKQNRLAMQSELEKQKILATPAQQQDAAAEAPQPEAPDDVPPVDNAVDNAANAVDKPTPETLPLTEIRHQFEACESEADVKTVTKGLKGRVADADRQAAINIREDRIEALRKAINQ